LNERLNDQLYAVVIIGMIKVGYQVSHIQNYSAEHLLVRELSGNDTTDLYLPDIVDVP
jgi:hypothetical protein